MVHAGPLTIGAKPVKAELGAFEPLFGKALRLGV